MAHTYAFAIGGAILLALTLTPTLASKFMPPDMEEKESPVMHALLRRFYQPLFKLALGKPKVALSIALAPIMLAGIILPFLGGEFMPKLEEGNFWIRATLPMSVSLDQSSKYVGRMREILRGHPEVTTVVSQLGRPDDGTDPSGFFNIELFAPLEPFDEWPRGLTKEKLTEEISERAAALVPGRRLQLLADDLGQRRGGACRASRARTRSRSSGRRLHVNESKADAIHDVMGDVPGIKGPSASSTRSGSRTSASRPTARCARATASTPVTSRPSSRRPSAARR